MRLVTEYFHMDGITIYTSDHNGRFIYIIPDHHLERLLPSMELTSTQTLFLKKYFNFLNYESMITFTRDMENTEQWYISVQSLSRIRLFATP